MAGGEGYSPLDFIGLFDHVKKWKPTSMKEKWDDRYSNREFAYGKQPNNYLKEHLINIHVGTILFSAEGEGRNSVHAATLGWTVFAFDLSIEGKKKAIQLAHRHRVDVNYEVGEFQSLMYQTINLMPSP